MTNNQGLLATLERSQVEYILIGGVAGTSHGASRLTLDIDVVYRRTEQNMRLLVDALVPHQPYLRGAPPGLPFLWDLQTLRRGLNFTLMTTLGALDLLGEVAGGGTYDLLFPHSNIREAYGVQCRVVNLAKLIELKRAAGRPKDLEAIAELEAILEEGGEP